jgi:hypothetical protein
MLCSHQFKFIYLKTLKTAGTSVEVLFERYCVPPEAYQESHFCGEQVTEYGIVGFRGLVPEGCRFYNHISAQDLKRELGDDIWNSYFKFCVVRNPFDKVVSMFWHRLSANERTFLTEADFSIVRQRFEVFCSDAPNLPRDSHIYKIDSDVVVDKFIRYENLYDDIQDVKRTLGMTSDLFNLRRYKGDFRLRNENFREYYSASAARFVAECFRWELEYFNYQMP